MTLFDPAREPSLHGILTPATTELAPTPLDLIAGSLPKDLIGTYYRNGPNPRFTPIGSYTYPYDGDGMVHAVRFGGDGHAMYTNRFVRTPALIAEERAGRALWGGLMSGVFPTGDQVGAALAGQPKDLPDINVIRHGGRLLALAEGAPPFLLNDDLTTVGPWTFDGRLPMGMCAHPKIDPISGEMVLFRYGLAPPLLSWSAIARDGSVRIAEQPLDIDATYMVHDFVITRSYVVLFVCPAQFDLAGNPPLRWTPDKGTRIAIIARDGARPVRWITTDPFWIWHFANAYERVEGNGATTIVIDHPWWSALRLGPGEQLDGGVRRTLLDPDRGTVRSESIDDALAEFPRFDDRLVGAPHRYFYAAGKEAHCGMGEWNLLRRYDMRSGGVVVARYGNARFGEAIFAPVRGGRDEDDGYVLVYAFNEDMTHLLVLRAHDIAGEPAAVLRCPQRVPMGLHGNWVAA